mmetsp:Transcript_10254/g.22746  ORF Transcript_10254/g.22746 Transcript_10254/m.22746 type:complete len:238 (-) Transcript_10254:3302-4015(-)
MLTLVQCNPAKSALMMLFMTWLRKRSWLLDESMFTIRSLNSPNRMPAALPWAVTRRTISCGEMDPFIRRMSTCSISPISTTIISPEEDMVPVLIVCLSRRRWSKAASQSPSCPGSLLRPHKSAAQLIVPSSVLNTDRAVVASALSVPCSDRMRDIWPRSDSPGAELDLVADLLVMACEAISLRRVASISRRTCFSFCENSFSSICRASITAPVRSIKKDTASDSPLCLQMDRHSSRA